MTNLPPANPPGSNPYPAQPGAGQPGAGQPGVGQPAVGQPAAPPQHHIPQQPAQPAGPSHTTHHKPHRSSETKPAYLTTEFYAFIVVSLAVLIAAAVVDNGEDGQGFGADKAWWYVTLLAVGYMISRGLSKVGSRSRQNHSDH